MVCGFAALFRIEFWLSFDWVLIEFWLSFDWVLIVFWLFIGLFITTLIWSYLGVLQCEGHFFECIFDWLFLSNKFRTIGWENSLSTKFPVFSDWNSFNFRDFSSLSCLWLRFISVLSSSLFQELFNGESPVFGGARGAENGLEDVFGVFQVRSEVFDFLENQKSWIFLLLEPLSFHLRMHTPPKKFSRCAGCLGGTASRCVKGTGAAYGRTALVRK